jgi:Holliday junction resolvase RusA-like endonuclease
VFVPGVPVPKQSFRFSKGGGWQPARVTQYQKRAQFAAVSAMRSQGWHTVPEGHAVRVVVRFAYPLPKATRKAERDLWRFRTARPDADNLIKGTLDALSKAGVWSDDQQGADLQIVKVNAPRGHEGATIWIEIIDEKNDRLPEQHSRGAW